MTYFPLFFDLKDRNIVIFGGGRHAYEKIVRLAPFGANIRVVSPRISEQIRAIPGVQIEEREHCAADLEPPITLAILAEDRELNAALRTECKARNIPVNAVDMPELCDAIFPAVIATENLCIGVSSGGASPTAAIEVKRRIEELIPDGVDGIIEWMIPTREWVRENFPSDKRNLVLRCIFSEAFEKNRPLTEEELALLLIQFS